MKKAIIIVIVIAAIVAIAGVMFLINKPKPVSPTENIVYQIDEDDNIIGEKGLLNMIGNNIQ